MIPKFRIICDWDEDLWGNKLMKFFAVKEH